MINKNAYYINFSTIQFLGGRELLKSMPTFFNRVYFCKKYGNALVDSEKEETFSNIAMVCRVEDMDMLRNIIRNNFLYINDWDSIKFTDKGDFGFSFIGGNIKFILMPFRETENGYNIKYYEVESGECIEADLEKDKQFFLDSSINENGDFIRICDFNIEEMSPDNSKKFIAERKIQPEMAVYTSNKGYAIANTYLGIMILMLCVFAVLIAYYIIRLNLS